MKHIYRLLIGTVIVGIAFLMGFYSREALYILILGISAYFLGAGFLVLMGHDD